MKGVCAGSGTTRQNVESCAGCFRDRPPPPGLSAGYGKPDIATNVSFGPSATKKYITTYFRKTVSFRQADCIVGGAFRYSCHGCSYKPMQTK